MARIKIDGPASFPFHTHIPIRITDINYGGHAGNDAFLALVHEARMQFLRQCGYTELEMAGIGLIMQDAAIEFKGELFYGDTVRVSVAADGFTRISFDLYYKLEKIPASPEQRPSLAALVKTGMVGYDYTRKKIVALPEEAIAKLQNPLSF